MKVAQMRFMITFQYQHGSLSSLTLRTKQRCKVTWPKCGANILKWSLEMCSLSLEASPVNLSSFKEMDHKPFQIYRMNLTSKQIHVSLHI